MGWRTSGATVGAQLVAGTDSTHPSTGAGLSMHGKLVSVMPAHRIRPDARLSGV